MAQVALPEMRRYGYSGSIAAGGTLGILIPPGIVLVPYAILTEQNLIKLFAAAFIPEGCSPQSARTERAESSGCTAISWPPATVSTESAAAACRTAP